MNALTLMHFFMISRASSSLRFYKEWSGRKVKWWLELDWTEEHRYWFQLPVYSSGLVNLAENVPRSWKRNKIGWWADGVETSIDYSIAWARMPQWIEKQVDFSRDKIRAWKRSSSHTSRLESIIRTGNHCTLNLYNWQWFVPTTSVSQEFWMA